MQKFNFDRVFSDDGKDSGPKPRPRRNFRADEVEAIRAEAYAAGERSAVVKTEQLAANSINVVAAGVDNVLSELRAELDIIRDESTRLAAQIARKFVSHIIETAPELYLERCIDECLEVMHREPEVLISIPAGSPESFKRHLSQLIERRSPTGGLKMEESPSLKGIACRLAWRNGGAEIALEDALQRMDQIIIDHISALTSRPQAPAQQTTA